MGKLDVGSKPDPGQLRTFMQRLLRDVHALEQMLRDGLIESGVRRIGAEQELFLVGASWQPAPAVMELLALLDDPRYTTELARFNLEFNLDPAELGGACLRQLQTQIELLLDKARKAAAPLGVRVVMCGILPTLQKEDLRLANMTPKPRYALLNDAMSRLRGGPFRFRIKGVDELIIQHDNVMLEACNTSFQVHLQVAPADFARLYNVAQLVAAPVLAAAVNAPLLFGRRLWRETRIALFEQSVDVRDEDLPGERKLQPRVSFGTSWLRSSVLEIFHEDIARYRVLIGAEQEEDPFAALAAGRPPQLYALRLHNGTVYRWNRPCYGISAGKPHLRIEFRMLPAGPTPLDEAANAAFWLGLMHGVPEAYGDVAEILDFSAARDNMLAASRLGLGAQLAWPGAGESPVQELICERLLAVAESGLRGAGVDGADAGFYLGVIHDRVRKGQTGARWQLDSLAAMKERGSPAERMAALTAAMVAAQEGGRPVHEWPLARLQSTDVWAELHRQVDTVMTTDIFTVHQDELVDLAASVMDWRHVRHVPVEDDDHRLVGLVTHRALLRHFGKKKDDRPVPVSEIMQRDPITIGADTPTLEAIRIMREKRVSCLPVVRDGRLAGLVTEHDLINLAAELLEQRLRAAGQ